jgi:hypothetical protein
MVHDLGQEFLVSREVHRLVKRWQAVVKFSFTLRRGHMELHFTKQILHAADDNLRGSMMQ